jgi:hypothetical protein
MSPPLWILNARLFPNHLPLAQHCPYRGLLCQSFGEGEIPTSVDGTLLGMSCPSILRQIAEGKWDTACHVSFMYVYGVLRTQFRDSFQGPRHERPGKMLNIPVLGLDAGQADPLLQPTPAP